MEVLRKSCSPGGTWPRLATQNREVRPRVEARDGLEVQVPAREGNVFTDASIRGSLLIRATKTKLWNSVGWIRSEVM